MSEGFLVIQPLEYVYSMRENLKLNLHWNLDRRQTTLRQLVVKLQSQSGRQPSQTESFVIFDKRFADLEAPVTPGYKMYKLSLKLPELASGSIPITRQFQKVTEEALHYQLKAELVDRNGRKLLTHSKRIYIRQDLPLKDRGRDQVVELQKALLQPKPHFCCCFLL